MSETLLPMIDDEWKKRPADTRKQSLMTSVGLTAGEILTLLEAHRSVTLRQLTRQMEHPAYLVTMAVGALLRRGLVSGLQREHDLVIERRDIQCA